MNEFLTTTIEAGPIRAVVWEILYVIGLVLVLSFVLDRFLFKPVLAVLDERSRKLAEATGSQGDTAQRLEEGARRQAERLAEAHRAAAARIADAKKAAEQLKQERVGAARSEADAGLAAARERLSREVAEAEKGLRTQAEGLARTVAKQLLGREVA